MHLEGYPLYPCTEDERQLIRKELGMKDTILQEDIDAILEWFCKEPHLADAPINRDYVEKMLIAGKGSRERTKHRIDDFYRYRSYAPELVQTRVKELSDPEYDPWAFYRQCAMLKLYKGKRISVFAVTDPNPSNFMCEVVFRNTILLGDLRLKFDYMLGEVWILDLQNASFGHILRINPTLMQKFVNIVQDGIGFKMYELHIVNAPSFGTHLLNLFKQFVKPKIIERIQFHSSIEELQKHIPPEYLPKDFGGEQPSLDEFKEMYRKELQSETTKDYLIGCCQQTSDEQKRIGDKFQEEYLVGSFKKLDFD